MTPLQTAWAFVLLVALAGLYQLVQMWHRFWRRLLNQAAIDQERRQAAAERFRR